MAHGAIYGISPSAFLRADPVEQDLLMRILVSAIELGQKRDRLLANMIINELSQAMERGRKRRSG